MHIYSLFFLWAKKDAPGLKTKCITFMVKLKLGLVDLVSHWLISGRFHFSIFQNVMLECCCTYRAGAKLEACLQSSLYMYYLVYIGGVFFLLVQSLKDAANVFTLVGYQV